MSEAPLILFQGDSITDSGRVRETPENLGTGYPLLVAAELAAKYPGKYRFLNRGIGGDRVPNLQARWEEDCLALKPKLISILIGINDTWRAFDSNDPTDVQTFYENYRQLLQATAATGARILILEPFVLPFPEDRKTWRLDLDAKILAVRQLAAEFADAFIPLDGLFAQASVGVSPAYWAQDGVHPTPAGHGLIARHWVEAVERANLI